MTSSVAAEWRAFRDDRPGARFANHHRRMRQHGTRAGAIVRIGLGAVLVAGGIVLLFIPGPGLLVAMFGFALFAGESKALARALDRCEPPVRRRARQVARWWRDRSRRAQVALGSIPVIAAAVVGYGAW